MTILKTNLEKAQNDEANLTYTIRTYPFERVTEYMSSSTLTEHLWWTNSITNYEQYFGPFQITKKYGLAAYKLQLCHTSKNPSSFSYILIRAEKRVNWFKLKPITTKIYL